MPAKKNKGGRPQKMLSEATIRNAMKHTQSNLQASRYLNVCLDTYRRYARSYYDKDSGKNLYDLHSNNAGKGISRVRWNHDFSVDKLKKIVTSTGNYRAFDQRKLKARLVYEGFLRMECYQCGHHEKRAVDLKQPLLLDFKDGNKHNWNLENLQMLCYNCYYLYVGDLYTDKQVRNLEDGNAPALKVAEVSFDIDESFLQHFRDLGLEPTDEYEPGDEFISRM